MNGIPDTEYFNRIKRLQGKMEEENLDAILCYGNASSYENIRYLTKYWPMFEVGGVLVGKLGQPLVLIGGEAPEFGGQTPFGMESVRVCSNFGHTSGSVRNWIGVQYHSLAELMLEVSGGKGVNRLGLADYSITPHRLFTDLESACLPNAEIVNVQELLESMRMNKSKNEIDLIRQACKISEKAFDVALGKITPDLTEYELEGVLVSELYKNGGEGPSFPVLCYSGFRSRSGIGRSTHEKLGRNNLINIDIGCHYGGYASAYGRPIIFGKMTDQMKREIDFLLNIHEKLIKDWVKPGMTTGEVYEKYYNSFVDNGFGTPPASASHGIGVFEGEPPSFRKNISTIIKPGMTIAGDHFFRSEKYGFRFEDCYMVTDTGTEIFTDSYWKYIEL